MATARPPPTEEINALAAPFNFASAWTEAVGEMTRASISTWSAIARSYGQAGEAYASLLRQAIGLEEFEALSLTKSAEQLLENELHALEEGSEQLLFAPEDALSQAAGSRLVPLPE
jgi:hypothetical protein